MSKRKGNGSVPRGTTRKARRWILRAGWNPEAVKAHISFGTQMSEADKSRVCERANARCSAVLTRGWLESEPRAQQAQFERRAYARHFGVKLPEQLAEEQQQNQK